MIVNGKEYPFEAPTNKIVMGETIPLTESEINEIVLEWAANYDAMLAQTPTIDYSKRQSNITAMNEYMASFVGSGALTAASFDLFLSDTSSLVTQYLGGGGRLITWIETTNRNGYNASTSGFKTKTAYRGNLVNGVYERAETILAILNNL
jgi:hypothetical protein